MPVLPGMLEATTGTIFFVDSVTGSDHNDGKTSSHPLATIDKAIGLCTADKGDRIYVMPGHNEGLSGATSLVMDVAGVQVIGLGVGHKRPILDFDATDAAIEMDAASCRLSNLILRISITAGAVAINVDAADCEIDHCEFTYETTGDDWKRTIDVGGVNRCNIHDNTFHLETSAPGHYSCIALHDTDNTKVVNNYFAGAWNTAVIYALGSVSQDLYIAGNVGRNDCATVGDNINMSVANTGHIEHNRFTSAYTGPTDDTFVPGVCGCVENYVSKESAGGLGGNEGGVLVPYDGRLSDWHVAYHDGTAFAGGTGNKRGNDAGSSDPYPLFLVKGMVECMVVGVCGTAVAGANTFFSVGVTGATGLCVAKILSTLVEPGNLVYGNALTGSGLSATAPTEIIKGPRSIMEWTYTSITGGYLDYICKWRPLMKGSEVIAV